MANKYVQYGAIAAAAVVIPPVTSAISTVTKAAIGGYKDATFGVFGRAGLDNPMIGAADAATKAAGTAATGALSTITNTFTNPAFLQTVGVGLLGLALGSGSKRPSLNFPNIAAAAAVALNVSDLVKQGQAALKDLDAANKAQQGSGLVTNRIAIPKPQDPNLISREKEATLETTLLKFPLDISGEYNLTMKIYKFNRLDRENRSRVSGNPHTLVKLPLPANLMDVINAAYSEVPLGMIGGPVLNNMIGNYTKNSTVDDMVAGTVRNVGDMFKTDPNFGQVVARKLLGQVIGEAGTTALNIATGNAPNPHMAVSFQGVNLKRYNFSWRLSPNSYKESVMLDTIILNLQAAALPGKDGAFLFEFPDICVVEMKPSNLISFKPVVIDTIAINYAPSGTPSFFTGGQRGDASKRYPTEVEIAISLKELDVHTSEDSRYAAVRNAQTSRDGMENN